MYAVFFGEKDIGLMMEGGVVGSKLIFPETKEKPKSKLKKMWNSFFCTVGIHDYKKEEIRLLPHGVVGELKTCQYCRNRVWKNKMESIE